MFTSNPGPVGAMIVEAEQEIARGNGIRRGNHEGPAIEILGLSAPSLILQTTGKIGEGLVMVGL